MKKLVTVNVDHKGCDGCVYLVNDSCLLCATFSFFGLLKVPNCLMNNFIYKLEKVEKNV